MKRNSILGLALISAFTLSACSKTIETKSAASVKEQAGEMKQSVAPDQTYARSITAQITVKKDTLLKQDFFYGADLQYSSIYDKDYDLYSQSSAMGHVPAFFRVNGKELQLVADDRRLFPSDVNHPEHIISRFNILSETDDSYVLSEANSAEYLVTTIDQNAASPRDHWARSFQYVSAGDYFLQESSVVMKDGSIVEVMESIFPRQTLAVSSAFEKFKMDPASAVGASEGPAARYRFLPGEAIFNGEEKLAYAQHFDIGNNATIDWYATANISDEHLEVARQAVEGWNRYFKNFAGINREVVKFKGRLPSDIKIGDPRYNVINWDSRKIAGAAYESQANDPFTGKQSHSLIYMPVAWFQIGMDYWTTGQYSDKERAAKFAKHISKYAPNCMRDLSGAGGLLHSGRMSDVEAKAFSIQLMKQTLFHEVGHALGLAHNFKGSLSFDRADPTSLFSTSIMDYNDYEIERAAFKSTTSEDGPVLEYDRQALSAIYNKAADVASSDKVLPACNDEEADTEDSGKVDPLCIRYDIEKDPTKSVVTAFNRVAEATLPGDVTLSESILKVKDQILTPAALAAADTPAKYVSLVTSLNSAVSGVMGFYVVNGKASIAKTVRTNIKALYPFEDKILPVGYSEQEMRERAYSGVEAVLKLQTLPASVNDALKKVVTDGTQALATAPVIGTLGASAAEINTATTKVLTAIGSNFEKSADGGMVKLRIQVLRDLARVETLPLFFGKIDQTSYDYEASIVSLVYEVVADKARAKPERMAAAATLASYSGRGVADDLIKKASEAVDLELTAAASNDEREFSTDLLGALSGKDS